tara:strand:- start:513 stop:692 length:180 start_codon:yes stop_codon:yes gene_type:complete
VDGLMTYKLKNKKLQLLKTSLNPLTRMRNKQPSRTKDIILYGVVTGLVAGLFHWIVEWL